MNEENLKTCIELRHELHKNAELSGREKKTIEIIDKFLRENTSFKTVKEHGYIYAFKKNGEQFKNVCFRADMDGLPIEETTDITYKSKDSEASHKCGHDGHCAVAAGLALEIEANPIKDKNIFIIFQPSEEIGTGARKVVQDGFLEKNKIDEIYAFHNIPGFENGSIICKNNVFACTSKGVVIKLIGKHSHAAYPEFGINPAYAAADIIKFLRDITKIDIYSSMVLCTIVNVNIGEKAFGTSAGIGEVMFTIRAENEADLGRLENEIVRYTESCSKENKLDYDITFCDEFPETRNNSECVEKVKNGCKNIGLSYKEILHPFRWSEDFGYFTKKTKGAMLGIGDGILHPQLHTAEYDFPDNIIEKGVDIFYELASI
ncbi:MAG: amidohydrolase [Clostridiaceae bacterium]|jgi:amidohydrolase|nr:amidohydrolase [Clostridiaceae bacterium]